MTSVIRYIQQHLSLRLGLLLLAVVGCVLGGALAVLFHYTKQYVLRAAERHAMEVLDSTVKRIAGIMDDTEAMTTDMERRAQQQLNPDSLLVLSRQMLEEHPNVDGFTIALQPDFFPQCGRHFSAYSLREADGSITSVVELQEYFGQAWYKTPWEQKRGLWMEPYIDNDISGILTSNEYNFSYVKPFYTADGQPIGVLCTDLLLKELSQTVTAERPFPNSSCIMLGKEGRYIVHPDTTKLVRQTIFSDPDPQSRSQVVALGHSMLAGQTGAYPMIVDGREAHVFYRPLERTGWSIAIVCPDSDVFSSHVRLLYMVWTIFALALIVLLLFCYRTIRRAIVPVNQLAESARRIAEGHFDEMLPQSTRVDTVGQLQNSFVSMQQSLNAHVSELRSVNEQTEQRNTELQSAYELVREAAERKTAFVRDMTHQVRTPLNIINGFTQVVTASYSDLPADQIDDIMQRLRSSAKAISHITQLLSSSATDDASRVAQLSDVACNAICQEAVDAILETVQGVSVGVSSSVDNSFTISTNHGALLSILTELLDNAVRFAPEGAITVGCSQGTDSRGTEAVVFSVTDQGPGIAPADGERIFAQFTKLNAFSEGMGLGLSLSRHNAQLLGGELTVDHTYTEGARFVLTLPVKTEQASAGE